MVGSWNAQDGDYNSGKNWSLKRKRSKSAESDCVRDIVSQNRHLVTFEINC
jgi:hypothetical protein